MHISISELLKFDDNQQDLQCEVDLSTTSFAPIPVQFTKPVQVSGKLKNAGGVIMLRSEGNGVYETFCDRCGKPIEKSLQFEICENFVKSEIDLENDPEAVVLNSQEIDLTDTVYQFAIIALPTKNVCSEDCKGLCPNCGKNLNVESCTCKDDEWDPRFEALRGLFD